MTFDFWECAGFSSILLFGETFLVYAPRLDCFEGLVLYFEEGDILQSYKVKYKNKSETWVYLIKP